MASDRKYLDAVLEALAEMDDISYRPMMGEYILYFRGMVIGGIYDNRFLLKPTKTAVEMVGNPVFEPPYEGAKEMLLICEPFEGHFLNKLIEAIYEDLPKQKKR